MCFCCCCDDKKNKIHPTNESTFIKHKIMSVNNYQQMLFKIIVYSVTSEQFIILDACGSAFIEYIHQLCHHIEFESIIIYRISCITTNQTIYTNKHDMFGVAIYAELNSYIAQL